MKNLNELGKSRGVLLFAFNSKTVSYVDLAVNSTKLIKKFLNLPVTLVTDSEVPEPSLFDKIIMVESKDGNVRFTKEQTVIEWRNFDRYRVYEFSPYYETILIDVDYLILDNTLIKLFEQNFDYRLQYRMTTPAGLNQDEMGPISLPMVWATVVLFRKTEVTKMFFDLIGRIQRNYGYYRALFGIRDTNYRNDFAFSIANIILNGYTVGPERSIPWPLFTIEDNLNSITRKNNFLVAKTIDRAFVIPKQNIHIMDKAFLQSQQFQQFVQDMIDE